VNCSPFPVGKRRLDARVFDQQVGHSAIGATTRFPFGDLKVIYQIEAAFSITAAPGATTGYTSQSNTVKAALGFGDSWLGFGTKEYGNGEDRHDVRAVQEVRPTV